MRLRLLVLLAFLLLLAGRAHGQGTFTTLSCLYGDVNAAINNTTPATVGSPQHLAVNGDTINVPAGTCSWPSTLTINNVAILLQGAGAVSSTSYNGSNTPPTSLTGTDQTIINPATTGGASTILVNVASGNPLMRITGFAFLETPSSSNAGGGIIQINGHGTNFRIDHNHFFSRASKVVQLGIPGGVSDHNSFDVLSGVLVLFYAMYNGTNWNSCQSETSGFGDCSYADSDHFGTNQMFITEDNYYNGEGAAYVWDCVNGGRGAARYSSLINTQGFASHGLSAGANRGCRVQEFYQLYATFAPGHASSIGHPNSGSMIAWGITTTGYGNIGVAQMERIYLNEGNDSEEVPAAPNGWGYCGTKFGTGVATTTAGSTAVTGTNFQTTWPTVFNIVIGVSTGTHPNCQGEYNNITGPSCAVASVQNSTALTLVNPAGASVSGIGYSVGSPWDGGNNNVGYPCLDSPGRGQGDLLNGANFPARINTVTNSTAWPHQVLTPMYFFANNWTPTGTGNQGIFFDNSKTLLDNRDYFMQYGTGGEPGSNCTTSPCNIIAGVNQANRAPVSGTDTCPAKTDPMTGGNAPGVGWWNPVTQTLYRCHTTNTWSADYTPFTYPDPLAGGIVSFSPASIVLGSPVRATGSPVVAATLSNETASTITLGSASFSGPNASDFAVIPGGSCGATLIAATFCTINFQFTPTAAQGVAESATYSLPFTGASGSPVTLALSGTSGALPGPALNQFAKETHDASRQLNK